MFLHAGRLVSSEYLYREMDCYRPLLASSTVSHWQGCVIPTPGSQQVSKSRAVCRQNAARGFRADPLRKTPPHVLGTPRFFFFVVCFLSYKLYREMVFYKLYREMDVHRPHLASSTGSL